MTRPRGAARTEARIARDLDRLEAARGRPRPPRRRPPLDELILTILSQNTTDTNRDRAYRALRRTHPTWEDVRRAGRGDVERAIRVGGLARTKSRVIQEVLRRVKDERGRLDLGFLRERPADEARRYLARFTGVGDKTVCCVLLFACGHAAFPVDTHIHRVTRRLGWVPVAASRARAHEILGRLIPPERHLAAHLGLIELGRTLCRPRDPACPRCPLSRSCPHAARARPGRAQGARRAVAGVAG